MKQLIEDLTAPATYIKALVLAGFCQFMFAYVLHPMRQWFWANAGAVLLLLAAATSVCTLGCAATADYGFSLMNGIFLKTHGWLTEYVLVPLLFATMTVVLAIVMVREGPRLACSIMCSLLIAAAGVGIYTVYGFVEMGRPLTTSLWLGGMIYSYLSWSVVILGTALSLPFILAKATSNA